MPGKAADKRALDAAERRRQCLDLRRRGASFRAIGRSLGVSEAQAHRDYMAALAHAAKLDEAQATENRALDLLRLDAWLERLEPFAAAGSPGHINTGLKILERRAKLLGLDAPAQHQHEHSGPGGRPIQHQDMGTLSDAELDALIADGGVSGEGAAGEGAA